MTKKICNKTEKMSKTIFTLYKCDGEIKSNPTALTHIHKTTGHTIYQLTVKATSWKQAYFLAYKGYEISKDKYSVISRHDIIEPIPVFFIA